jgi:hypothetical protein
MRAMVEKVVPLLPEKKRVIEFGNQRYTADKEFKSTEDFYKSLGFEYLALDVNENMGAVICDLNQTGHSHRAELVTNNGTSEHIFNQAACFQNAHDMSSSLMLHILPFTPWLNHGFFNYNPILFRDLAFANDYEMVFTAVANRSKQWIQLGLEGFIEKHPVDLARYVNRLIGGGEVFVVSILKKTNDKPFRFPFQGKYKKDIEDKALAGQYASR